MDERTPASATASGWMDRVDQMESEGSGMSEVFTPSARIHRVTTRRRNLRALQCPLESELLVAEFAGELPPEVALAVREHIAVCESCGSCSQALRQPYELLASLGSEP